MAKTQKSVRERLEAGEFRNKVPYLLDEEVKNAYNQDIAELEAQLSAIKERKKEHERSVRAEHNDEQYLLTAELRRSLEEEFSMVGHPKAELLWEKAWEEGHSSGYDEVVNCYEELLDLVK